MQAAAIQSIPTVSRPLAATPAAVRPAPRKAAEGIELAALLDRAGALAPAAAIGIARRVAESLLQTGAPHGALSPSSIQITPCGAVGLRDFGTLPVLSYAAPERFDGARADRASDVFSLGVLLCRMLGAHPFAREERAATLLAIVSDEPALPEATPSSLRPLLRRMLAKLPEDRLTLREVCAQLGTRLH